MMKRVLIVCLSLLNIQGCDRRFTQNLPVEEEPWEPSPEKILALAGKVRAGQDLSPQIWPEGAQVSIPRILALLDEEDDRTGLLEKLIQHILTCQHVRLPIHEDIALCIKASRENRKEGGLSS